MAQVGIQELLEAGVHFGHQTRRWNPKMRRFIFAERGGIHIIDLQQTVRLLAKAQEFAADVAGRGGTVMFVGTKKQARDAIKEAAERAGMPYVNQRWLGGLLTNFQTISRRIKRLHDLDEWTENGTLELLPTRERIAAMAEREKLDVNLGGVRDIQRPPDTIFIVDMKTEAIAVREAHRLSIPIIALVDTNVDPDPVSHPIPGNDDAIRSCKLVIDAVADVVAERHARFRAEEERARQEAEERERREAEERAAQEALAEQQREQEAAQAAAGDPVEAAAVHAGSARAGDPDPASAPAEVEPAAAQAAPRPASQAGGSARPAREEAERAERDRKAPAGRAKRPRGGEEADVKAAEERESATRPDQEVG